MKKIILSLTLFIGLIVVFPTAAHAGYVNGYFRSNGTYVNGYYRTEPNLYKYDNYSFDGDWGDAYNDNSYYRSYGYDPEPYDNDYVSPYSYNSYSSYYDYDDYDYSYDDYDYGYDSYDYDSYYWY